MMKTKTNIRTYSELSQLNTFEERFKYLALYGRVGEDTFGFDRYLNQMLYKSSEWQSQRNHIIERDLACDMGLIGHDIHGSVYVHHMNPINIQDIEESSDYLFNPEYLICLSFSTHQAVHYGNDEFLNRNKLVTRTANDQCPWKKEEN